LSIRVLSIFGFRSANVWLFWRVFEQELLEAPEVVGIEQVNAAGQQFTPEGLACRRGLVRSRPESDAPAFLVCGFDDFFQFLTFNEAVSLTRHSS